MCCYDSSSLSPLAHVQPRIWKLQDHNFTTLFLFFSFFFFLHFAWFLNVCVCLCWHLGLFLKCQKKKKKKRERERERNVCDCMKSVFFFFLNCITIPTESVALSALAVYLLQLMVALGCLVRTEYINILICIIIKVVLVCFIVKKKINKSQIQLLEWEHRVSKGVKNYNFSLPFPLSAPICTSIPGLLFAPPVQCEFKPAGSCLLLLTASSTLSLSLSLSLCVCVCVLLFLPRLLNEGAWRNQALHRADTPKPGGEGPEAHLRAVRQDLWVDGDQGQIHRDAQRWGWWVFFFVSGSSYWGQYCLFSIILVEDWWRSQH